MKPFAFVFPGQGSQSVGMLEGWGDHPAVRRTLDEASAALDLDVGRLIREGPKSELDLTTNTQPVMLTAGIACYRAWLEETDVKPAVVAGHSLGEYSALVAAGAISFADALPLPDFPRAGGTIGFLGRFDEPRKGMSVLVEAVRLLDRPDLRLVVAGRGNADALRAACPQALVLGEVSDATKAALFRSVDVLCAPNTGGESFGIVLAEAMSAGAAVVASDLDAFRRVLGPAALFAPPGDPVALAAGLDTVLADPVRRLELALAGSSRAPTFDWSLVADQVLRVYEAATRADPRGSRVRSRRSLDRGLSSIESVHRSS